jgi:hypothetical protein
VIDADGETLLPSKLPEADQELSTSPNLAVRTTGRKGSMTLISKVEVVLDRDEPRLKIHLDAASAKGGRLAASIRPYNPEGIQFIEKIRFDEKEIFLRVNREANIFMSERPERVLFSNYDQGDVFHKLGEPEKEHTVTCRLDLATAAAVFPIEPGGHKSIELTMSLDRELHRNYPNARLTTRTWSYYLTNTAALSVPDRKIRRLYEAALRTLILLSAHEIVPGPYAYRRVWFRDACLMIHAMLIAGLAERTHELLDTFPARQKRSGYFLSQDGEWDSNGQVLWIFDLYQRLTGRILDRSWMKAVLKGAEWISRKRVKAPDRPHDGLLPAGFSAEHLGPNDYYYWDDFWAVAGLRGAARLAGLFDSPDKEKDLGREADDLEKAIYRSLETAPTEKNDLVIPASPYRRMDAGAIGSLVADYPLRLTPPGDARIMNTVERLMARNFFRGGFFQDMIHSGINIYLTLDIAQTLLRAGDDRYGELIDTAASLASPTGQWPEAIHPFSGGGCMGDGQHGWAAAEWVMMIRNLFVREEDGRLIVGSGIFPRWLEAEEDVSFGPTLTAHGPVTVHLIRAAQDWMINVHGEWRDEVPTAEVAIPGFKPISITDYHRSYPLERSDT